MLAELARVLRCGGRALVTVWASEQEQPGKLAKWEPIGPGESSLAKQESSSWTATNGQPRLGAIPTAFAPSQDQSAGVCLFSIPVRSCTAVIARPHKPEQMLQHEQEADG